MRRLPSARRGLGTGGFLLEIGKRLALLGRRQGFSLTPPFPNLNLILTLILTPELVASFPPPPRAELVVTDSGPPK